MGDRELSVFENKPFSLQVRTDLPALSKSLAETCLSASALENLRDWSGQNSLVKSITGLLGSGQHQSITVQAASAEDIVKAIQSFVETLNISLNPAAYSGSTLSNPKLLNIIHAQVENDLPGTYRVNLTLSEGVGETERNSVLSLWSTHRQNLGLNISPESATSNEQFRFVQERVVEFLLTSPEGREAARSGDVEAFRSWLGKWFSDYYSKKISDPATAEENARRSTSLYFMQATQTLSRDAAPGVFSFFPGNDIFFDNSKRPAQARSIFSRLASGYSQLLAHTDDYNDPASLTRDLVIKLGNWETVYAMTDADMHSSDLAAQQAAQQKRIDATKEVLDLVRSDAPGYSGTANMLLTAARLSPNSLVNFSASLADTFTVQAVEFVALLAEGLHMLQMGINVPVPQVGETAKPLQDITSASSREVYVLGYDSQPRSYSPKFKPSVKDFTATLGLMMQGFSSSLLTALLVPKEQAGKAAPTFAGSSILVDDVLSQDAIERKVRALLLSGPDPSNPRAYQYTDAKGKTRSIVAEDFSGDATNPIALGIVKVTRNYILASVLSEVAIYSGSDRPSVLKLAGKIYQDQLQPGADVDLGVDFKDPAALSIWHSSVYFNPQDPKKSTKWAVGGWASNEVVVNYSELPLYTYMDLDKLKTTNITFCSPQNEPLMDWLYKSLFPEGREPWRLDNPNRFSVLRDIYGIDIDTPSPELVSAVGPLVKADLVTISAHVGVIYNAPPIITEKDGKQYLSFPPLPASDFIPINSFMHEMDIMADADKQSGTANQSALRRLDDLRTGLVKVYYTPDAEGRQIVVDEGTPGAQTYYYYNEEGAAATATKRSRKSAAGGNYTRADVDDWIIRRKTGDKDNPEKTEDYCTRMLSRYRILGAEGGNDLKQNLQTGTGSEQMKVKEGGKTQDVDVPVIFIDKDVERYTGPKK